MRKRYLELTETEMGTLQEGRHHHPQFQFRDRCHCLLLSHQGHDVSSLMAVFKVSRLTIYHWLNRWRDFGLRGLYNQVGQGRPSILTEADVQQVKQRVRENRQQLKEVRAQLKTDLAKDFSDKTLKRFLKSLVANGAVTAKASRPPRTPRPIKSKPNA